MNGRPRDAGRPPLRITILLEPPRDGVITGQERPDPWLERFAAELGRHAGAEVPIVAGLLSQAPATGMVIARLSLDLTGALAECSPALRRSLAPRVVPLDVYRGEVFDLLATHRLAAAIETLSYHDWMRQSPELRMASGPHGLCSIASTIGGRCSEAFRRGQYCLLESDDHYGLPHLLADYLRAYDCERRSGARPAAE